MSIYSLGSGKIVDISVPENSVKNNLPVGTVIYFNGYGDHDMVIIKNRGISENFAYYGASYDCVNVDTFKQLRVSSHELKWMKEKQDNRIALYITDEVKTPDEVLTLYQKSVEQIKIDEDAKIKEAQDKENQRSEYASKFPHLQKQDGKTSSHALGAKNIKRELKLKFPLVKFEVKSKSYSGGDSIDVRWEDGPKTAEVEAIINKYEEGSFDGMTDSYNYNHKNVWPDVFGGAKYVMAQKSLSHNMAESLCKKACLDYGIEYQGLDAYYKDIYGGGNGHNIAWKESNKEVLAA
jgi:hypothetical protein